MKRFSRLFAVAIALIAAGVVLGLGSGCGPGPNPVLNLYIARHGQTDWNAERKLQGQTDTQLNANGRAQAERLAERLRGVQLDQVYSSTLARSRETAEIAR